jgi:Ni/Fe-hydrogenase 1 B-type cytochrome subunit
VSGQVVRVAVWPAILRVVHWVSALALVVLLVTGWLMQSGLVLNDRLYDVLLDDLHLPAGHVLGLAIAVRLYLLLVDRGVTGHSALLPGKGSWQGIKQGLVFYTSFTRTTPPRYYAHHPVWAPVYLVWWLLLLAQLVTGLLLEFARLRGTFGLSSDVVLGWHLAPFAWLVMFTVLHVVSVFLNDLKGDGSDASGMINGHRTFDVGEADGGKAVVPPSVSLGDVGRRSPPDRKS